MFDFLIEAAEALTREVVKNIFGFLKLIWKIFWFFTVILALAYFWSFGQEMRLNAQGISQKIGYSLMVGASLLFIGLILTTIYKLLNKEEDIYTQAEALYGRSYASVFLVIDIVAVAIVFFWVRQHPYFRFETPLLSATQKVIESTSGFAPVVKGWFVVDRPRSHSEAGLQKTEPASPTPSLLTKKKEQPKLPKEPIVKQETREQQKPKIKRWREAKNGESNMLSTYPFGRWSIALNRGERFDVPPMGEGSCSAIFVESGGIETRLFDREGRELNGSRLVADTRPSTNCNNHLIKIIATQDGTRLKGGACRAPNKWCLVLEDDYSQLPKEPIVKQLKPLEKTTKVEEESRTEEELRAEEEHRKIMDDMNRLLRMLDTPP